MYNLSVTEKKALSAHADGSVLDHHVYATDYYQRFCAKTPE